MTRRWEIAALAWALAAGSAAAKMPGDWPFCDLAGPEQAVCRLVETYCIPYLEGVGTLEMDAVEPVPPEMPGFIRGEFPDFALGYRDLSGLNAAVVYFGLKARCELLFFNQDYGTVQAFYRAWRAGAGAGYAATSDFEPIQRTPGERTYAAVFLAAPRSDGRVTEIAFNWNLNTTGLTRLMIGYLAPRSHTRRMFDAAGISLEER